MHTHPDLAAWLPLTRQAMPVELLTVTKPSGAVWRFAGAPEDVIQGPTTWIGSQATGGLLWRRSKLKFVAGIQLGECKIEIHAREGDTIAGVPVPVALRARVWDDATFLLSRAYFDLPGTTLRGILPRFQGQLSPVRLLDGMVELTLKPASETFNRAVPPVYQAACHNTVFDSACGVSRETWTTAGTVQPGSTAALVNTALPDAAGYFNGGVIVFVDGALAGVSRTVRTHAGGGALAFFNPLPAAPGVGDAFTITPGCDRSLGAAYRPARSGAVNPTASAASP